MMELPTGWEWATIGDVGEIGLGRQRAPKWHNGPNMRPYLRVANVFEDRIDLSDVKEMDFSQDDYERFKLEPGDILLNEGQSPEWVGRPAMYRGELPGACFTNSLIRFRPHEGVVGEFALAVFRHLLHSRRFMREARITTNIAHLSSTRFASVEFPLPPTAEQERIVAAVEEHLSRVGAARASLALAQQRVDRLVASSRATVFQRPWRRRPLGSVAETQLGKMLSEKSRTGVGSTPYLRNRNVRWGVVDMTHVAEMDFSAAEIAKYRLEEGDILICEGGAGVGRTATWRGELRLCCYQKALHRVRVGDELLPEFFVEYMRFLVESRRLERSLSGVAIGHLPQEDLRSLPIPVPSLAEQRQAVEEISLQESLASSVAATVRASGRRSTSLGRSILAAACSGQLVPQDPADEPASLLLARIIRTDRMVATPRRRAKKATAS